MKKQVKILLLLICVMVITVFSVISSGSYIKETKTNYQKVNSINAETRKVQPENSISKSLKRTKAVSNICDLSLREHDKNVIGNTDLITVSFPAGYLKDGDIKDISFIEVAADGSCRYEDVNYSIDYANTSTILSKDEISALESLTISENTQPNRGMWMDYCNGTAPESEGILSIDINADDTVKLEGWAADFIQDAPLSALYLKVGENYIKCPYGYERTSVADYYNDTNLTYTGFSVVFPKSMLNDGNVNKLCFIEVAADGSCRYQDVNYSVNYGSAAAAGDVTSNDETSSEPTASVGKAPQWYDIILVIAACIVFVFLAYFFLSREQTRNTAQKFSQHRFLFSELVKRDFTLKYKRTILGMLWSIISPLVNLLIMWLVFNRLLGNNVEHFVIYLFAGQLAFNYFNDATTLGMTSLIDNAQIFTKVNVPKYMFLFSRNVSSLINFGITLLIFFLFVVFEGLPFTWSFLMLLYPITCMIIFNIGVGLILSALYVFFRDMQYLWGIFTQITMWLSAIFYSIESYPQFGQNLFLLNPIYLFIRYFRKIVIESSIPSVWFHLLMAGYTITVFLIGCRMYKKYNHEFLYYI